MNGSVLECATDSSGLHQGLVEGTDGNRVAVERAGHRLKGIGRACFRIAGFKGTPWLVNGPTEPVSSSLCGDRSAFAFDSEKGAF